mgnify:CR=1 FL=1
MPIKESKSLEYISSETPGLGIHKIEYDGDLQDLYESDLYEKANGKYGVVISNPPIRAGKVVVNRVIEEGYQCLSKGGSIWVVIQKKQGGPSLEKRMEEGFGNVETVNKEKGYFIFKSTKE